MTTKQSTKKGSIKGKAGSKKPERLRPRNRREEQLVEETLRDADEIRAARARMVAGVKKISPHASPEQRAEAEAEAFKAEAVAYARKAYDAALAHYEANHKNPFALSRLAVVYDETDPRGFHMVVTLPASERSDVLTNADLWLWATDVELICRTLEHPDCSDHFRRAFGAIFTDDILEGSNVSWTTPTVSRVMLMLALMDMTRSGDGDPEQHLEVFKTLREELNEDETAEAVRASVVKA